MGQSVSDRSRAFNGIVPKFLKQPYWDVDFVSSDCLGRVYLNGTANRVGGRCRPDAAWGRRSRAGAPVPTAYRHSGHAVVAKRAANRTDDGSPDHLMQRGPESAMILRRGSDALGSLHRTIDAS